MRSVSRFLLVTSGTLCVVLGVAGIFLPVLPTTPFLLLAAFCYCRSSPRFYSWLLQNRWFGSHIKNYREGRGIPLRGKIFTLVALWITIGFTSIAVISPWWGKVILVGAAVAVTVHVLRLKTYRR